MKGNSNIFVGDRSYKTNFFLKFNSKRTEGKFVEESYIRTLYSLYGFLIATIIAIVINFMSTDCFLYYISCHSEGLLISTLIIIMATFVAISLKWRPLVVRILIMISSIYPVTILFEIYNYHTALVLIAAYTSVASKYSNSLE
jgi:hypothetical protein